MASKKVGRDLRPALICLFVCSAAMQFGYDTSYFSGIQVMQPFLKIYGHFDDTSGEYAISSSVLSLVTSIINAGEFLGAVSSFWIGDKIGRRGGLFLTSTCVIVGTVIQVAGTHEGTLIAGRLVLGYAVGLISCVVPLYIAECAPANIRGALVSAYQMFIGFGLTLGVCVDYGSKDRSDTGSFRIPMAVQFLLPILLVPGLMFFVPESPRWLLGRRGPEAATRALRKLNPARSEQEIEQDVAMMEAALLHEHEQSRESSWISLFRGGVESRKAYIGFSLQALQQASGINFITGYGISFFFAIGIQNTFLISLGLYIICYPVIWISMYLIERFGRRPILIGSGAFVSAVLLTMGGLGLSNDKGKATDSAIVAMVYLFMFCFNMGWGPCVWVVCSEICTGPNRGKLMSFSTGSNWFFSWMVSFTFPYLYNADSANLGPKIGFLYGSLMAFACVWVFFFVPETKGRSLEEIDEMFENQVPARKFSSYVCRQDYAVNSAEDEKAEPQAIMVEKC